MDLQFQLHTQMIDLESTPLHITESETTLLKLNM